MKKLNQDQVSKAMWYFWLSFGVLLLFAFFSLFFFFKSYSYQQQYVQRDIDYYKQVLNKQQLLKQKTDSLLNLMNLVNTGKVENDVFLQKYIADNKAGIENLIGADSTEFITYKLLMNNVGSMLKQKDTLIDISNNEQLARRDLIECMNKVRRVKQDLSFDPTRNFSSR